MFCQGYVVFQDRWSVTAVVSQNRFTIYFFQVTMITTDVLSQPAPNFPLHILSLSLYKQTKIQY